MNATSSSGMGGFSSLFNPAMAADPFPLFAQLRSAGPLMRLPIPMRGSTAWLVSQFDEAVQILKDKRFTVDAATINPGASSSSQSGVDAFFGGRSMISVDDPDHTRLRNLVSKAFTPRYIESLRPRIQEIADELLNAVQANGKMDLVRDYAYPLPINVISEMLGVPKEDRYRIRTWSQQMGSANSSVAAQANTMSMGMRDFRLYVVDLVAQKRQNPANDLISQLIQMEQEGDSLSENELLGTVTLLIFAGHETTSNLIGIGTLMLLDHPEQLERLKSDPTLLTTAIDELLRFNGPVTMPAPRFVTEAVEIGGQHLEKGDMVMIMLASANRDPEQFTDADELNIARTLNRHIGFGQGIHYCLGAPLARLEGEIAFRTLFQRMPTLHLAVPRDKVEWRGSFGLRGLSSLPIEF